MKHISVIIALLTIIFAIFLWVSSIDDVKKEGEAYGFNFGSSKEQVFKQLMDVTSTIKYQERVVLFNKKLKEAKNPLIHKTNFSEGEFYLFKDKSEWNLFYESFYFFDSITLYFCENKLCKVKRKRAFLEWP